MVAMKLIQLIVYISINYRRNCVFALFASPITPLLVSYLAHCIAPHWNQFFSSSLSISPSCLPAYLPIH